MQRLRPLSALLLRPVVGLLARTPVTPNTITFAGLLVSGGAAYLVAQGWLAWGGIVLLAGSALDMLDGELARATGRASTFGAFLDSTVDRLQEAVALFGVLLYYLAVGEPLGAALSYLALVCSFLVSYVRARAEGLGLKGEEGLMARPARVILLALGLLTGWLNPALGALALLSALTALQRGVAVWRQTQGPGPRAQGN